MSTKRNLKRDRSAIYIFLSMGIVNNVIFSLFFVNYDEVHKTSSLIDYAGTVFGLLLIPSIFIVAICCDLYASWRVQIRLYYILLISLIIFALEGDETWYQ